MAWQLHRYQELMNINLAVDSEITTYCKLLEGEKSWLEAEMQNMSIYTKITSSYSGGLSLVYRGLTISGLNFSLNFQSKFISCGGSYSFSHVSSSKVMVVKKIETCGGKLVFESSDVLLSK